MGLFNRILELESAKKLLEEQEYVFVYASLENNTEKEARGYVCREHLKAESSIEVI